MERMRASSRSALPSSYSVKTRQNDAAHDRFAALTAVICDFRRVTASHHGRQDPMDVTRYMPISSDAKICSYSQL
jgi:hypothetical protein